jgi:hypothetical protein
LIGTVRFAPERACSDKKHWTHRVKGIGSGYWRAVGEVDELIDKAKEMAQRTLFGTGFARILSKI